MKKIKSGFTIIEVVLVLAIAGLIFMMVFIALPALQRSQRDTQRKNDIARVQAAISSYQANNRGRIPPFDSVFIKNYLLVEGDTFNDPDGEPYCFKDDGSTSIIQATTNNSGPTQSCNGDGFPIEGANETAGRDGHPIIVNREAVCNGETAEPSTGSQKVAILYKLEGGGVVCLSN